MRLGISSRHGEDPDLLRLGAAVSQRQRHLPVGGAVCGVGPANLEKTPESDLEQLCICCEKLERFAFKATKKFWSF